MKVQIEKKFELPAGADVAWAFLQDIEAVTSCMPGAKIVEKVDAANYKGTVAVKVGPASMSFKGTVTVQDVDAATRSLRLIGKGTDSTGSSAASMDLLARIDAVNASNSTLVGDSTVAMSGRAATFGGRMMSSVADQVLKQFADNFTVRVAEIEAAHAPATPTVSADESNGASASTTEAPSSLRPAPPPRPAQATELNGLSLMWAVFKDWLRGLFSGKKA